MSGGIIIIESACNAAEPDIDLGGANIAPYSVTAGTVQFGYVATAAGATFFGIQYYTVTNYPNLDFQAGVAKTVNPWNSDGQTLRAISITIDPNMTFSTLPATPDPNIVLLGNNGTYVLNLSNSANFNVGTGGLIFVGAVNQVINGTAASYTFNNMTVNMTAGFTTSTTGAITTLNVANYTQTQGNWTPPANFNVTGNWTHDNGTFTPGVNTVTFTGGNNQQINGTGTSETFYNVVVNKSGNTLTAAGSKGTITTQNLTQTAGGINMTGLLAPSTLNINGNYLLTAGTFTAPPLTNVSGNWTRNGGTFTPGLNRVLFVGTANSQTIGGSSSSTFYNLTTNNTFATVPQLILGINTTATNDITMTAGLTNLAGFTLTHGVSAAAPGTLTYAGGWVYGGTFARYINAAILPIGTARGHFPMGSAIDYHPLWFGTSAGMTSGGLFTVQHNPSGPGSVAIVPYVDATFTPPAGGATIVGISNSIWTVDRGAINLGSNNGQLRFGGNGFVTFITADINASNIAGTVGTYGAPTNVTATYFEVNRTALVNGHISNRAWYIGTTDLLNSPLPIELTRFTANECDNNVCLDWTTLSETNNDFFTIEKTKDGVSFEQVGIVDGAGNSTAAINYSLMDYQPYNGQSYYRLKQTDFDGNFTYSALELVDFSSESDFTFDLFPNPNDGTTMNLSISAEAGEEVLVVIYDALGRESYSKVIVTLDNGGSIYAIDPASKLASGIYVISATSKEEVCNKKLIVR